MSLSDRLRRMEARIEALERGQQVQAEAVVALTDAIEDAAPEDGEAQESVTLEGDRVEAGERDQTQSLDG